ncbi:hypothetical protein [Flavobacterium sp.]|uniref:hypothetical protein n=1 Tax=Flavobacterium sp. TaxID=239 RepID=UPI00391CBA8C
MRISITLFFVLLCEISFSQEKKLVWTERTCESGIEKAIKHSKQGYYFSESFGLAKETDLVFISFYKEYLETKYNIISINGGCIMDDNRECYSDKMDKLIIEKFGADIFKKSLKEAEKLYGKG